MPFSGLSVLQDPHQPLLVPDGFNVADSPDRAQINYVRFSVY